MTQFEEVKAFHKKFDDRQPEAPTALSQEEALRRANFIMEEVVELLHASSHNKPTCFYELVEQLKKGMDETVVKIENQAKKIDNPLVSQADALIDTLYFTYGTFVLMGVQPAPLFSIVHQANMGKLFPDGQPHYHPLTGKVLKPQNWEHDFAPEKKLEQEMTRQSQVGKTLK
ncbi:HAD family hydrolase [Vagococcus intermedius]|uniref:HAD family hydrolase n=1 Tax=Vagococcus intermedius TaxID=2991418 RepID=A0AAF0CW14_9ENTE|nr:HAD family hydrolase [Vagococcus intermedius]WEG73916.1 HAD family hydrolase [Vagococcus intermedius]WEG75998.1 HAD family hydrolase [Vagococcus intermedius]